MKSADEHTVARAAQLLLDSAMGFQACRDDDTPVNDAYFEAQADHQVQALIAAGWRPPVTPDATPDTPVDPRLVATIREFIVEEVGFDGGEAMTDQAERLARRVEGSLRSQASGTPDPRTVAEAMYVVDSQRALADAHPVVQQALLRRARAAITAITGQVPQ